MFSSKRVRPVVFTVCLSLSWGLPMRTFAAEHDCSLRSIAPPDGTTLAMLDGVAITQGDVDVALASLPASTRAAVIAQGDTTGVVDQLALGMLLHVQACRRKLDADPKAQAIARFATQQAYASVLIEAVVAERMTTARLTAWYDDHGVRFHNPQVKARHILVKEKADAQKLMARIVAGEEFAMLAKTASIDTGSGAEGGELGWFEKKMMVESFADAAFGAKVGQLVGPVQSQFGWHLILVEDRRELIPFAEAEETVRANVREEIVEEYLAEIQVGHPVVRVP